MDASVWIAGVSAVVATGAACVSLWQAKEARDQAVQARRQADAAHGDVAPTFHVEPIRGVKEEWALCFVARNFNRHAVLVDTVTINFPDTFLLLKGTVETRTTNQIVEGYVQPAKGVYRVRSKETLVGLAPGGEHAADLRFSISLRPATFEARMGGGALQTLSVQEGDQIAISYAVNYKVLDGLDVTREKSGMLTLVF
ncbi:hypothetical protein ACFZ8E_04035 [Methylobacterium sp. HMF5984]|uniref:hypothetical protein n=1 Tax=Methylobacterium sp. HMF5984 TaxID=3367370 RepID=UPI003855165F